VWWLFLLIVPLVVFVFVVFICWVLGFRLSQGFAMGLSIVNDLVDVGVGSLPIVGDVFDIVVIIVSILVTRSFWSILNILELIPGIDILPLHSIGTALGIRSVRKMELGRKQFLIHYVHSLLVVMFLLKTYQLYTGINVYC